MRHVIRMGIAGLACGLAYGLAVGVSSGAWAQADSASGTLSLGGSDQVWAESCDGRDVIVRGDGNTLTLEGACRSLRVEGSANTVRLDMRPQAPLVVRGNTNRVRYGLTAPGNAPGNAQSDAQPDVQGNGNILEHRGENEPDKASAHAPDPATVLTLREEQVHRQVDCAGRDVLIEGRRNEYTLIGGCASLLLRGEHVTVHAQMRPGGLIHLQGRHDVIFWTTPDGSAPQISLQGENSRIVQASTLIVPVASTEASAPSSPVPSSSVPKPQTPASQVDGSALPSFPPALSVPDGLKTGTLTLHGDHEARDVRCDGRDAKVDGSYGLIVLRNGCRSVMVKGDSNHIQAEMLPGARISIIGSGTTLAYVVMGTAQDRIGAVSVSGEGSRVWQAPALGAPVPSAEAVPPPPPALPPVSAGPP